MAGQTQVFSISLDLIEEDPRPDLTADKQILCPVCKNPDIWRDGMRYSPLGEPIQRWLCKNCETRFSKTNTAKASLGVLQHIANIETKTVKSTSIKEYTYQIPSVIYKETKNLGPEQTKTRTEIVPERRKDLKGAIVEHAWNMKLDGYAEETIRVNSSCLRALLQRGADLFNIESVKEALYKEKKWSQARKRNAINAYNLFLQFNNMSWNKPTCHVDDKFPFIPTEQEIDTLITGSGKKNATFLQTLKETAMRSGEAKRLLWTNIDQERSIITLNQPEKRSNPRMWKVTPKLIGMIYNLPKKDLQVFTGSLKSMKTTFNKTRKRLANTLQNPRLLQIHFHTLRHWKATMLYHQTLDPYYVKNFLGHKCLKSTEVYINIHHTMFESSTNDEFTVKIAETPQEIKALLEVGFEYVCQKDTLIFMRKRK